MTLEDISNIDFKPAKYANQKSIYTNKANDGTYGIIRVDANIEAVRNLKNEGQAYALWMYLNCNQDGYIEAFSPQHIANLWDMDVKTVRRAFAALEKHGYLENIGQNHYIFYESLLDNTNMDKVVHVDKVVHMDKVVHSSNTNMDNVVQVNEKDEIKNQHGQSCPHDMDKVVHPTWTKLSTNMDKVVHSNITYNTYNNTIDNTKLSSHNSSTKVENCFKESHVITKCDNGENGQDGSVITKCNNETCDTGATGFVMPSRIDGENRDVCVLSKDEFRPIYTSDGVVVELPIRNILDGLKDALTNQKNEKVLREISEKCDLTDRQKNDIDDTVELWRLGF